MYPNLPIGHCKEILELRAQCDRSIQQLTNSQHRRDLDRLLRAANRTFTSLDIELITCRRTSHYTAKYRELYTQCQQEFRTVSKYLLQALLMQR